jgi:hypothetical protein
MDITFTVTPGNFTNNYPISSRVLTENLLRDKRFNVHFNDSVVYANYFGTKNFFKNIERNSNEIVKRFSNFNVIWSLWIKAYYATIAYKDEFLKKIKGDYLLFSGIILEFDLFMVKYAIENGIKVVFGGAVVFHYSFKELRTMMKDIGVTDEQLKNIIFVRGFVDLTTDLYKIVKEWKDTEITENDFSTFWECEKDYLQDLIPLSNKFDKLISMNDPPSTNILFDNRCFWGKCKYCAYKGTPNVSPVSSSSTNVIINNVLNILDRYQSKFVFITDNFFRFTDKNKIILKELVKHDVKFIVFSGVLNILDKEYLENVNKYISLIKFGLESTNDFALNYIAKGYGREEIAKAFDNFTKYAKKDLQIYPILIFDLPYLSKEDFLENVDYLLLLKDKMFNSGFDQMFYNFNTLSVMKPLESKMVDGKFLQRTTMDDKYLVGRSRIWKYIETLGFDPKFSTTNNIPLRRLDRDGNPMLSDLELIPDAKARSLISSWDDWKSSTKKE